MKKSFLTLAVLLALAAGAYALPSYSGLRGLNRTVDAKPIGAHEFSLALFSFLGFSEDTRTANLSGEYVDVTDTEHNGTWHLTTAVGLGDKFELAGRVSYVWNSLSRGSTEGHEERSGSESDKGFSEAAFALKYGFNPGGGGVWMGIAPFVGLSMYDETNAYVVNNGQYDGIWRQGRPMFEMRRPMLGSDFSAGADFLFSVDMKSMAWHTNVGYHYFKQHFQFTDHNYTTGDTVAVDMYVEDPVLHLATGIEFPMDSWTIFAEAEWRRFLDRDFEAGNGERYDDMFLIQPGMRFALGSGYAMDLVGGFSFDNFDPEWSDLGHRAFQGTAIPSNEYRANFAPFPHGYYPQWGVGLNLMYSSDFNKGPAYALMSGTVTDVETGKPLEASLNFPGTAVIAVVSDGTTGFYEVELPEGEAEIVVTSPGYVEYLATVTVAGDEAVVMNFELKPVKNVTGTVTDMETGEPLQATVSYGGGIATVAGTDGTYAITVPEGRWTLTATMNGYRPAEQEIIVSGDSKLTVDFQLETFREGRVLSFDNIYFDSGSATIKRESYAILNEVVEILKANPNAKILIAGHTDSDGSEAYNQTLSEQRAQAVFDYLVEHGISADRLSTVGYGESRPVAPNTSPENKAKNRRIEFVVISND